MRNESHGYSLLCKRLHRALFRLPKPGGAAEKSVAVDHVALAEILRGVTSTRRQSSQNRA